MQKVSGICGGSEWILIITDMERACTCCATPRRLSRQRAGGYWLSRQATHLHWRRPGGSTRHRDTENVVGFLTSTPKANRRSSLPAGRARIELALTPHTVRPRACSTGVVGRLIAQTPPSHAQAEPKVSKRMLEIDRRLRSGCCRRVQGLGLTLIGAKRTLSPTVQRQVQTHASSIDRAQP